MRSSEERACTASSECSRRRRRLHAYPAYASDLLADPTFFTVVDTYGSTLIHACREGCSAQHLELTGTGDGVQADNYLDKLTRDEYRQLYQAAQRLSKLALERRRSYTDFPNDFPYDDLSGDDRNPN